MLRENIYINEQNTSVLNRLHMREAMAVLELDLTKEALINRHQDSKQTSLMRILTGPLRCCRLYRTQRCLATVVQRSIDIAIKDKIQLFHYDKHITIVV